jgi:hypothetical protein
MIDLWIAATGLTALGLLLWGGPTARRWAPLIGLSGQPAWLYLAWHIESLGVLAVVSAYTVMWASGCIKELRA